MKEQNLPYPSLGEALVFMEKNLPQVREWCAVLLYLSRSSCGNLCMEVKIPHSRGGEEAGGACVCLQGRSHRKERPLGARLWFKPAHMAESRELLVGCAMPVRCR